MHEKLLLFTLMMVPMAANSQLVPCNKDPFGDDQPNAAHAMRTTFEIGKPFPHPIALPGQVAAILRTDNLNQERFQACSARRDISEIPLRWFSATEITLAGDELPALIVKAANACLVERRGNEDFGGFWVFRQAQSG